MGRLAFSINIPNGNFDFFKADVKKIKTYWDFRSWPFSVGDCPTVIALKPRPFIFLSLLCRTINPRNFEPSCQQIFQILSQYSAAVKITLSVIRMSHWHQQMVDGAKFWITCKRLKVLRKASCLQLIQNSAPSTICWCQLRYLP